MKFKMVKTIFKNIFSKPSTRRYPFVQREPFKGARGHIEVDIDQCIFCGICSKQCPTNAITVDKDEKSWAIDKYKCIICEYCTEKCPRKCISSKADYSKSSYEKGISKSVKEG